MSRYARLDQAAYSITYKPAAAKASRKVHPNERKRIKEAIEDLTADQRPHGYLRLTCGVGECRIRIGDYRVVYEIKEGKVVVLVLRVGHRSDVHR